MISRMIRLTRKLFYAFILDSIAGSFVVSKPKGHNSILVVRLDGIGDFVLWADAARGLRRLYPKEQFKITLLGNSLWTDLAESLNCFDEIWALDRGRFLTDMHYRFAMIRKVRRAGFNTVIHPTFSRDFLCGDTIVRASQARKKIGFQGDMANIRKLEKRISDQWYTQLIATEPGSQMELLRNAEFMRAIGVRTFRATVPRLPIRKSNGFASSHGKYYVLSPGAGWEGKCWPLESFAELARHMFQATGWTCMICGGLDEVRLGVELSRMAGVPVVNLAGKTDVIGLVATIGQAEMLIGNDSGGVHIAAALSVPSVCIMGGGHPERFVPYQVEDRVCGPVPITVSCRMSCFGCNWKCIFPVGPGEAVPCIKAVSVDDVWKEVQSVLGEFGYSEHRE